MGQMMCGFVQCALTSKLSCIHPNYCFAAIMADQSHFDLPLTHSFQISYLVSHFWLESIRDNLADVTFSISYVTRWRYDNYS